MLETVNFIIVEALLLAAVVYGDGAVGKFYQVPSAERFVGNDGSWAAFAFTVGKQEVSLLPSTTFEIPWIVSPLGCQPVVPANQSGMPFSEQRCEQQRGGVYDCNKSPTCRQRFTYSMKDYQVVEQSGFDDVKIDVGFEDVILGNFGEDRPNITQLVVGGLNDWDFSWTGLLGIAPRSSNFSDMGTHPSLVQRLKQQNVISRLTYSYAAGASYRSNDFGSLILGGVDLTRVPPEYPPDSWWDFYGDEETALHVRIENVTLLRGGSPSSERSGRISTPFPAVVDSSRPYLYLPQDVCDQISKAWGLEWDTTYKHYLINETQHKRLKLQDVGLSFDIGPSAGTSSTVNPIGVQRINLPYQALSLNLTWPRYDVGWTRYMPIMPSPGKLNILGRALLQEAVISADYERRKFLLSPQPLLNGSSRVVAIPPPSTSEEHASISVGLIVGSVVLIVALLALLGLLIWLIRRRKARRQAEAAMAVAAVKEANFNRTPSRQGVELQATAESPVSFISPMTISPQSSPIEAGSGIYADMSTSKELSAERNSQPIIRVYYEMDASPSTPPAYEIYPDGFASDTINSNTSGISATSHSLMAGSNNSGISSMNTDPILQFHHELPATPTVELNGATLVGNSHENSEKRGLPPASPIPSTPLEYYGRVRDPRGSNNLSTSAGDEPPASPIPSTPLEFYDPSSRQRHYAEAAIAQHSIAERLAADIVKEQKEEQDWVGRAPGLPSFNLVPPTPVSPGPVPSEPQPKVAKIIGKARMPGINNPYGTKSAD